MEFKFVMGSYDNFKEKQKFKTHSGIPKSSLEIYEGNEYHDYMRRYPFEKLKKLLEKNNICLEGDIHIASCGSGIDVYYLTKFFNVKGNLTATDLSEEAISITRKNFPFITTKIADNEYLPFEDDFFDYSFIDAGLHHLPRPTLGLYELLRVSKKGIIIMEPNDSWLTRLLVTIGYATEIENSGNYVYRYSYREIEKIVKSLFIEHHTIRFFTNNKISKNAIEFLVKKYQCKILNLFVPSLGNNLVSVILKKQNKL